MKNALLLVLAFALGAGVVYWFAIGGGASGGAAALAPAAGARGGGPAGAPGGFGGAPRETPLVTTALVRRERLYDSVRSLGTAQANESVVLTAKVTDTVRRVNFDDGDYVEAGTVLVELTNQEEEALLAEARANLDDAEKQLARLEDLAASGLAPVSDLDIARSRAQAFAARLNTVVARLRDRLIQAPFSGVLGFREVSPGTMLSPSTAITTIDDVSVIKLDFTVPETFLEAVTPGVAVVALSASYPDREFAGIVRTVASRVDPVTRAFTVRAHVPNDDRALRPGMLLTVDVVTGERVALVVPEGAVFQVQNRAYVYRVDADNVARQQAVELGARRFGLVEVLAGLDEGDTIVTEGIVKLRDGIAVRTAGETRERGALGGSAPAARARGTAGAARG